MLLDSNTIIYAAKLEHTHLRRFIAEHETSVSAVSYVEVLGYHRLTEMERRYFEQFFAAAPILPLSPPVLEQAVKPRQRQKMTLGDALVAGTALTYNLTLVTHNTKDFEWITELPLLDPFTTL